MSVSELENSTLPLSDYKPKDYQGLARMVIREGKSFKDSALMAGFSPSVAARGLQALMRVSGPVADAVKRETDQFISLDRLKPLAVQRLHAEIVNPKSSLGIKAIELAGRFKETDWFVRQNDVQIGVFAALGAAGPAIDAVAAVIPEDQSE